MDEIGGGIFAANAHIGARIYILVDVLLCSIAEYFYELASPYKQIVKILSATTQRNV